jgi:hypothetical protein
MIAGPKWFNSLLIGIPNEWDCVTSECMAHSERWSGTCIHLLISLGGLREGRDWGEHHASFNDRCCSASGDSDQ